MKKPVILCVDDERIILSSLKAQLKNNLGNAFQIELAESGEEALEIIEELQESKTTIPLVIADQIMGGMYGDELLTRIKKQLPDTHSIMLTGQASAESVGEAVNNAQLFRYISKPWNQDDLIQTVKSALQSYEHLKNLRLQDSYQTALNRILKLTLEPIPFEQQVSEALTAVLSTLCFFGTNKGSIFIDAPNQDPSQHQKSVIISHINNIDGSGTYPEDIKDNDCSIQLIHGTNESTNPDKAKDLPHYYRAPILLRESIIGFLYVYVSPLHHKNPQTEAFIRSVCHILASITRLSQYHQALEQHNTKLEAQVRKRTLELDQALQKQASQNDLLVETNKKLEYFATTDELTGLMNRRHFFEHADQEADRANRYKRSTVLAMLDLDFFKEINDQYGHQAGDIVLSKIAQVLSTCIREHDTLGRVGGEEFAIIMPETEIEGGKEFCERMRLSISDTPIIFDDHEVSISASFGLTELLEGELNIGKAMSRADQALYDSKHKGRNQISLNLGS